MLDCLRTIETTHMTPSQKHGFEVSQRDLSQAEATPQVLDIVDNIRNYIKARQLSKEEAWKNSDFLRFTYSEKYKAAKALYELICYYAINNTVPSEEASMEMFLGIDKVAFDRGMSQIRQEQTLIRQIFSEAEGGSDLKRNRIICEKLGLKKYFKGTKPYFFYSGICVVALLEAKDYEKISPPGSVGLFTSINQKFPLIAIKSIDNCNDDDERNNFKVEDYYFELINNLINNNLVTILSESEEELKKFLGKAKDFPRKYIPYLKGEKDPYFDGFGEDFNDRVLERLYNLYPYEKWYAKNILGLNIDNQSMLINELNEREDLEGTTTFYETQDEVQKTYLHEFIHSIARFFPVNIDSKEQTADQSSEEHIVQCWLSRFADEVIAHIVADERIPSIDYYTHHYINKTLFESNSSKKRIIDDFQEKARLLEEISLRIVLSEEISGYRISHRKRKCILALLFATEPVSRWEYLHKFLMENSLNDLLYNNNSKKFLEKKYKAVFCDLDEDEDEDEDQYEDEVRDDDWYNDQSEYRWP